MNNIKIKSIKGRMPFSFYRNIDYFYNVQEGTIIYIKKERLIVKESSKYVMNYICEYFLTNLSIYFKTLKKTIKSKYKNPIYLNNSLIFIYTKNINSYDNIWINFSNINNYKYENQQLTIIFKSGNTLEIEISKTFLLKQIKKIIEVKTYLQTIR